MLPDMKGGTCIIALVILALAIALGLCENARANEDELVNDITYYIEECGYEDDGFVAAVIEVAYGEYEQDPWLWTMIARYESHWNHTVRGAAGERGCVQIHPTHINCKTHGFTANELDWSNPRDQLRVGCMMLQERLDEGKSLWSAYSPWATRSRAWRLYKATLECVPGSYCPTDEGATTEDSSSVSDS